jgi:ADP-heptose:LPS heptosyltransferase
VSEKLISDDRPIAVLVDREGLGDVLLKLPLLRAIARGFPGRPIWWIANHTTDIAGPLRRFMPPQLAVVREEHARLGEPSSETAERLRRLPAFFLVFDTRTRLGTVWLARRVLTAERFFCCLPGYLLSSARPAGRLTRPRHIGLRALSLAQAALGSRADDGGELAATPAAAATAATLLPAGRSYVGLGVGSREVRKNWPLARFAELARALLGQNLAPVLFLGPQERDRAEEIRVMIPAAAAIDFTAPAGGCEPLDLAVAVARRLKVLVANDSGLGHLAGAAGTAVVSLFGPTDPRRWAPFAPLQQTIRAQSFGGEEMSLIPCGAVTRAVTDLLDQRHPRSGGIAT